MKNINSRHNLFRVLKKKTKINAKSPSKNLGYAAMHKTIDANNDIERIFMFKAFISAQ